MSAGKGPPAIVARAIRMAGWLPADTPLTHRAVVEHALSKVGTWEDQGPNRGLAIDEWNQRAGVPAGSYWCASFVAAIWADGGAPELPPTVERSNCDKWMAWALQTHRWTRTPYYGAAVLYGVPGDASHIGVIVRLKPVLCAVEGNTSMSGFSRNGVAVDFKEVALKRVLGYVHLYPLTITEGDTV